MVLLLWHGSDRDQSSSMVKLMMDFGATSLVRSLHWRGSEVTDCGSGNLSDANPGP